MLHNEQKKLSCAEKAISIENKARKSHKGAEKRLCAEKEPFL